MKLRWLQSSLAEFEENRRAKRRKVGTRGCLVYPPGHVTAVSIKEPSESGARVEVGNPRDVPSQLQLIELDTGTAHCAEVVWRREEEIGLRFTQSFVLDATTPKDMLYLREIWLASA